MNDPSPAWRQVAHDIGRKSNSRHPLAPPRRAFAQPAGNVAGKRKINSCCNAKSTGTVQTAVPSRIDSVAFPHADMRAPATSQIDLLPITLDKILG
jgi:hypothetical protein